MKKIGLIAGSGELPIAIAAEARSMGYSVYAVGLEPFADKALTDAADVTDWVNVGKLGSIIDALRENGISHAVMAGKVPKLLLYRSRITPDFRAIKMLFSLKDRSDDSILLGITRELEKDGITLLNITDFSRGLLAPEGVLTRRTPSENEWKDIHFGWGIARGIGKMDIGQTVVVKGLAVMAVEAIEGTDETIARGGKLAGEGAVVVKVSKPQQDLRFDVPAAGIDTLRAMVQVQAKVLAVEAGQCIILNKAEMVREADAARISIVGYRGTQEIP